MSGRSVIIAGCGYLGLAIARRLHARAWSVLGLTHSEETAASLATEPFPVRACDIADADAVEAIRGKSPPDLVIHCASSGRGDAEAYRRVYFDGARNLMAGLAPRKMIFTSSTSVYAQTDGSIVTEESPAEPNRETGQILRDAEDAVLAGGGVALRLAALYGPQRSVLLRKFFSGEAVIEGAGDRWINQIHRDDGASAFLTVAEADPPVSGIYNVCDDEPLQQRHIYEYLAARFDRPLPPAGEINLNRKRGNTNKRVSNAKLRALGWRLAFPSFFAALERWRSMV